MTGELHAYARQPGCLCTDRAWHGADAGSEHDLSDFEDYLLENFVDPAPSQLMQFYKDYLEYKKD